MTAPTRRLASLLAPGLLLLTLAAQPAQADDVNRLVGLIDAAGETTDPLTLLRELRALGDVDLSAAEIRAALDRTDVPTTGPVGQLLNGLTRLRVQGDAAQMLRSSPLALRLEGGSVGLGTNAGFRFGATADGDVVLHSPWGIRVGQGADPNYDLRRVTFKTERGLPVAKVQVNAGIFSPTVTVPLTPPPSPASARRNHQGASARLAGATHR